MIMRFPMVRLGLLAGIDATVLIALAPDWAALGRHLAAPDAWIAEVGSDQAAASLASVALWLCAAWIGLAVTVVALGAMPGWLGGAGRSVIRFVVPAALVRVIGTVAGLSITFAVVGPLGATAIASARVIAPVSLGSAVPSPTWPLTPAGPGTPIWPTGSSGPTAHVVAPGECLWTIARATLDEDGANEQPGEVSQEVQRLYDANRAIIGSDPSLLRPGQRLVEPAITP